MKIVNFLKDKWIAISLAVFAIITTEIFLMPYPIAVFIKIYIPTIMLITYGTGVLVEYTIKKKYYSNLEYRINKLDEKYLITELIPSSCFLEGDILKGFIEEIGKSMVENVNYYKYLGEDYKDYIELWIHEIKIPIATSKMIIENNKNEVTKSIKEEIEKIENYIEQTLFYARSNTVEKDYYIKKTYLKEIVNESIKKNKNSLIQEKVILNIHDLALEVNTDSKWIVFILNQIIQNSLKYKKKDENLKLEIYAKKGNQNIVLYIKDNGIGIEKGEVTRVFEKGFTGSNGRIIGKKSTGIGLYLCKKLCDKLGISIELNSKQKEGVEVRLIFPMSNFTNF